MNISLQSTITCPNCAHKKAEEYYELGSSDAILTSVLQEGSVALI